MSASEVALERRIYELEDEQSALDQGLLELRERVETLEGRLTNRANAVTVSHEEYTALVAVFDAAIRFMDEWSSSYGPSTNALENLRDKTEACTRAHHP